MYAQNGHVRAVSLAHDAIAAVQVFRKVLSLWKTNVILEEYALLQS